MSFPKPVTAYEKLTDTLRTTGYEYISGYPVASNSIISIEFWKKNGQTYCLIRKKVDAIRFFKEIPITSIT